MANMGYCRFHNTKTDIDDCIEALSNKDISSEGERKAAKRLLENILDYCQEEGIIEEYDSGILNDVIEDCKENE